MFDVTSWSPVCFRLFGIEVYWYGVAYVVGITLALAYAKTLLKHTQGTTSTSLHPEDLDAFLPWLCLGIVIGGRLGHILFYDPIYYLRHVHHIINLREGGMAFHGGLLGVVVATLAFCRKRKLSPIALCDALAVAAPIGLGLGRLANFINGELYGLPTTLPWGVLFRGVAEPRHPTQIYEALTEGALTAWILYGVWKRLQRLPTNQRPQPGFLSALFLLSYGTSRFLVDFFKDTPRWAGFTTGQILSLMMIGIGTVLWQKLRQPKGVS